MIFHEKLENGIDLIVDQMPGMQCVSIDASFFVGSAHEDEYEHGTAHFLEHVMFKGGDSKTGTDFSHAIESVGGDINARTDWDTTSYQVQVLKNNVDQALEILGNMLSSDEHALKDIEFEKSIIIEEIRGRGGSYGVLQEGFYGSAYSDHPICRPIAGTEDSIEALDSLTVMGFLEKHYVTGNFAIAIAGDIEPETARLLVNRHLSGLRQGPRTEVSDLKYCGGEVQFACPCSNGFVLLGFPFEAFGSADHYKQEAFVKLLGDGPSSRLFTEMREKRGLVYDVSAYVNTHAGQQLMVVSADGQSKHTKDMLSIIRDEMFSLAENVSEEEAERTKSAIIARERMYRDYLSQRVSEAILDIGEIGRVRTLEEKISAVEALSSDNIREIAKCVVGKMPTLAVHGSVRNMPNLTDFGSISSKIAA